MRAPVIAFALIVSTFSVSAQETQGPDDGASAVRGSIVEDRAAKKLLEAGDARLDAGEATKAVEVWKSVIERYPRSRYRFDAQLRLGNFFLDEEKAYDRARVHFEFAAGEDNKDDLQRAEATLKLGICYYQSRNFGKSFQLLRDVIEKFPVSPQVNEAYYHIGLGHFQLGHYSRAIQALEKVGTTLPAEARVGEKLEAGKRLFIRIDDADLAVLEPDQSIEVLCRTTRGDEEAVRCFPVGRNVRLVFGSITSKLGEPAKHDGVLDVCGGDTVEVTYTDEHTADRRLKVGVLQKVQVVGTALVAITDGAFSETVNGSVLGKTVNVRVIDADADVGDAADTIQATISVYRLKSDEELEAETVARAKGPESATSQAANAAPGQAADAGPSEPEVERWKIIDTVTVSLLESRPRPTVTERAAATAGSEPKSIDAEQPASGPLHSGMFLASVPLVRSDTAIAGDAVLQALPSDEVRLVYVDALHLREGVRQVQATAKCLEGNIGGVRVTKAEITDRALKIQTQLRTADALTQIGNRYKEFGLLEKAKEKYEIALATCEEVAEEARSLRGAPLEQLYVQLWNIYFAMDRLDLAAAMCHRLQAEFPLSGFVDDALLQLGEVARKQGDLQRAIGIFSRLVAMPNSRLRGEAQFGVAECYEAMAGKAPADGAAQLRDRAFQEYKRVYDEFPDSGRVGEAVAKMANYYYVQKDYARAVDVFETVLNTQPDAKFLDVILFNYGRCLFRMERKAEAKNRFEQLISEFPESSLAADAKKIADALSN
jgi:TolA-binding protein